MRGIISKDKKTVTFEELVVSNTLEIQAVIRILERKGLITADEGLEEVGKLKEEMDERIRGWGGRIRVELSLNDCSGKFYQFDLFSFITIMHLSRSPKQEICYSP